MYHPFSANYCWNSPLLPPSPPYGWLPQTIVSCSKSTSSLYFPRVRLYGPRSYGSYIYILYTNMVWSYTWIYERSYFDLESTIRVKGKKKKKLTSLCVRMWDKRQKEKRTFVIVRITELEACGVLNFGLEYDERTVFQGYTLHSTCDSRRTAISAHRMYRNSCHMSSTVQ